MSVNNSQNENRFDKILKTALRAHIEHVPADFADNVSRRVLALHEQKILAKIILQERLALAACITIPLAATVAIFAFPQILTTTWTGLRNLFYAIAKQIALMPQYDWQFWAALVAVAGFAAYSVFDLLFADR
ncbi:MAG: hypothetical protein ACYSWP_11040 [Planctomycetota bacterium]|jgi:hypothetical protein